MHNFNTNNKHNTTNKNKKEEKVVVATVIVYTREGVVWCDAECSRRALFIHSVTHQPPHAAVSGSGLCVCKHCAIFVEEGHPMPE